MEKISLENFQTAKVTPFIEENPPSLEEFKTYTGRKHATGDYILEVPRQLNDPAEDDLLERAFTLLFQLNVARETRAAFDVEKLRAMKGNRLVKEAFPLSFFYDYQFISAKTRISRYVHSEPYTTPYNKMAARIYGACFLLAQLDRAAETGELPDKLNSDFYFLPKGSFTEEFEQLNELALTEFIPRLTPKDSVQFQPSFDGAATDLLAKIIIHNDTVIRVDTSETIAETEKDLPDILRLFFFNCVKERYGSAPPLHPFTKIGFYRARFGEMEILDLESYFGDTLDERIEEVYSSL